MMNVNLNPKHNKTFLNTGTGMVFGVAFGLIFGLLLFDQPAYGMIFGMLFGLIIGAIAETQNKKS
jgi:uncharacterized membrane protein